MLLADLGYRAAFRVPELPALLAHESLELQDFLASGDPVGIIPQDRLTDCVLSNEFGDEQHELFSALGTVAAHPHLKNVRSLRLKDGFTEFGQRTYSLIHQADRLGKISVSSLIRVDFHDTSFLFGHNHVRRSNTECFTGSLSQPDLSKFFIVASSVLDHTPNR